MEPSQLVYLTQKSSFGLVYYPKNLSENHGRCSVSKTLSRPLPYFFAAQLAIHQPKASGYLPCLSLLDWLVGVGHSLNWALGLPTDSMF